MTFYEAAVEVLRAARRPLDYKTITLFAINRGLLGHIGHTPDVVMASCLIRAVSREDDDLELICLESGMFALRSWPDELLQSDAAIVESPVEVPRANVGILPAEKAIAELEKDDIQFRQAVRLKFEADMQMIGEDDFSPLPEKGNDIWPEAPKKYENVKQELNAHHNEHYNVCAAIVKILRSTQAPMRSAAIAQTLSQKCGSPIFEQAAVLAMRADNALRVSRGKRAIFMHIPPDMWTLSENFLARHILKIESKLYDMSRQLRLYSLHALTARIRELAPHALLQLAAIILKHLNYTIQSQCLTTETEFIFRAEEIRGLAYIPVVIKVLHSLLVSNDDILHFRDLIRELGYDHGILMTNGDISKDALNECSTKELPIYAYSARQIAPIMFDARIGVTPNELPIIFIDNNFFQSLSANEASFHALDDTENLQALLRDTICLPTDGEEMIETDVSGDDFLFDDSVDEKELD